MVWIVKMVSNGLKLLKLWPHDLTTVHTVRKQTLERRLAVIAEVVSSTKICISTAKIIESDTFVVTVNWSAGSGLYSGGIAYRCVIQTEYYLMLKTYQCIEINSFVINEICLINLFVEKCQIFTKSLIIPPVLYIKHIYYIYAYI